MKIIQITDLHIGLESDDTHSVDVRRNFLKILKEVQKRQPDYLVLTGDLCLMDGDVVIYKWIKTHLDELNIPYEIVSGNHDDSTILAQVFNKTEFLHGTELFFKKRLGNKTCLFLDTAVGELSNNQLLWLGKELRELQQEVVIFMHHPPVNGGVVFMENNHAMRGREQIQSVLCNYDYPITIFCGHYHTEKTICQQNLTVHITPSTYVQIDDNAENFLVDHYRIAMREITFEPYAVLSTLRYFNGKKLKSQISGIS